MAAFLRFLPLPTLHALLHPDVHDTSLCTELAALVQAHRSKSRRHDVDVKPHTRLVWTELMEHQRSSLLLWAHIDGLDGIESGINHTSSAEWLALVLEMVPKLTQFTDVNIRMVNQALDDRLGRRTYEKLVDLPKVLVDLVGSYVFTVDTAPAQQRQWLADRKGPSSRERGIWHKFCDTYIGCMTVNCATHGDPTLQMMVDAQWAANWSRDMLNHGRAYYSRVIAAAPMMTMHDFNWTHTPDEVARTMINNGGGTVHGRLPTFKAWLAYSKWLRIQKQLDTRELQRRKRREQKAGTLEVKRRRV